MASATPSSRRLRAAPFGALPIVVGLAAGLATGSPPFGVAVGAGIAITFAIGFLRRSVARRGPQRPAIDAFALSEPWRQFVQAAQRSETRMNATLDGATAGPLRERLQSIAAQLDHGLDETWRIAVRGDQLDDTVRRLDPVRLRSQLDTLRAAQAPTPDTPTPDTPTPDELIAGADPQGSDAAAIASLEQQLATIDRLKKESAEVAATLRRTQVRYDELVSRAAEIALGTSDVSAYEHDVEALVIELEALRQAVEETGTA